MGGEYVEGNVIKVEVTSCDKQVANHAMWHYANWRLWGKEEDRLAWLGLAGHYNKEEVIKERIRIGGRNSGLKRKGRKLSNEHIEKLKLSHLGKKHTKETRDKMSQVRRGRPQPDKRKPRPADIKQKISETMTGKKKSPSHCQKISEANKGVHVGKTWWVNERNEVKFCHECPGRGWEKGRKWKG
jgi:hypothetical protein